jgi:type VI secretion system protein ImpH
MRPLEPPQSTSTATTGGAQPLPVVPCGPGEPVEQQQNAPYTQPGSQAARALLATLFDALEAAPAAHDFFALLRRIDACTPELPRIGRAARPSHEALRLGQEPGLDFAPAALATFDRGGRPGRTQPRLGVRFFGLLGPQGPMPLHLTEHVRDRLKSRNDPTIARFLDVFHHRLLSLFHRAWADAQPAVQHDRPADDRYAVWLGAGCGESAATRSAGSPLPPTARLFQTGLLGARSRHPEGLAKLLAQDFGVAVRIEPWVLHRLPIALEDRSPLGYARNRPERFRTLPSGSTGTSLGVRATAGSRVSDRQSKFRIALGPLTGAQYVDFLPGRPGWCRLRAWVEGYAGVELQWDLQLALSGSDIPEARLGRRVPLGVAAWIGAGSHRPSPDAPPPDRADLRLRPDTAFLLRRPLAA